MSSASSQFILSSLSPELFDTHIHFFDSRFQKKSGWDLSQAILDAQKNQIGFFCNVGTDLVTSQQTLTVAQKHIFVFAACGYHPTMVNHWNNKSSIELLKLLQDPKVVAVGEIGLDFYHQYTTPSLQKKVFIEQLILAQKTKKPVLLHIREAYPEVLVILAKYPVKGIVHCFSGTLIQAQKFIDLGFFISFSGILTFDNAKDLQKVAAVLPLEKIVLETDAPYLTPSPWRGKINLPQYLMFTAQKLADLKNIPLVKIIFQTTINAFLVLQIPFMIQD